MRDAEELDQFTRRVKSECCRYFEGRAAMAARPCIECVREERVKDALEVFWLK